MKEVPQEKAPAFSAYQLSVNYDKTPVLWDLSFSIPQSVLVGILGPNGAGKSTLLKCALGFIKPISGSLSFFDKPLTEVRRRIAYVPQKESVDWDFPITLFDLVLMGRYGKLGWMRWPRISDKEAAQRYLDMVGLNGFNNRQISQLSGGQQQRAFIARALMQEADIYFMDEPFAGVDLATEKVIMNILKELIAKGKTVFVVHHDLTSVSKYFDWVILLNMRLIACGPVEEAFTASTIETAFGKNHALLEEAFKLSNKQFKGMIS